MARARNIKPGFFKNEDLAECSVWARLLFPGLWMLADREGRIEDRPKRIKGEIFPFDAVDVDPLLEELSKWGFIRRYVADGKRCIQINNFSAHQSPHATEKDSDLPDENGAYTVNERAKNGCITGKNSQIKSKSNQTTVNPPLNNSETTVNPQSDNALNPESLITDSLIHSVAKATVADRDEKKPIPEKPESELTKVELWSAGKSLLSEQGMPAKQCGTFVGKLVKDFGESIVVEAVRATVLAQPADAATYLKAACQRANGTRAGPETFREKDARIARQRWEEMTGETHPENMNPAILNVIDVVPKLRAIQ